MVFTLPKKLRHEVAGYVCSADGDIKARFFGRREMTAGYLALASEEGYATIEIGVDAMVMSDQKDDALNNRSRAK